MRHMAKHIVHLLQKGITLHIVFEEGVLSMIHFFAVL